MTKPTLSAIADLIKETFTELNGRALPVSEISPFTSETMPTLPLATVALLNETADQKDRGASISIEDDVLISFMFDPVRYQNAASRDTPFFALYDYEPIRDKLLEAVHDWVSPRGTGLTYRSMDIESSSLVVLISFRFTINERWCASVKPADGKVNAIMRAVEFGGGKLCTPKCEPEDPCKET